MAVSFISLLSVAAFTPSSRIESLQQRLPGLRSRKDFLSGPFEKFADP